MCDSFIAIDDLVLIGPYFLMIDSIMIKLDAPPLKTT